MPISEAGNKGCRIQERYYRPIVANDQKQLPRGGVSLEIEAGVAVVTIDRPGVRNAIGFATADALDSALDAVLRVGCRRRGASRCGEPGIRLGR